MAAKRKPPKLKKEFPAERLFSYSLGPGLAQKVFPRLHAYMEKHGFKTDAAFAEAVGLDRQVISNWRHARQGASREQLQAVCRFTKLREFELVVLALFTDVDDMPGGVEVTIVPEEPTESQE
jgi:transcriptional regulator with XRE-family HTH domain